MRRGFTLVELLLAIGLLSVLVIALIRLLDTSINIWSRAEKNRDLQEMGGAVLELFADDLLALEGGPRGDLLAEWVRFDLDRDGTPGAVLARVRLVRQAPPRQRGAQGDLIEVCWALLPPAGAPPDERQLGILWRGERALADADTLSFLDERFFDAAEKPVAGSLSAVTGGILWFEPWFASQTSVLHDGWSLGEEPSDCAASWDAWGSGRLNEERSWLNTQAAGLPATRGLPLVPRRIRFALEIERPVELRRRARLVADLTPEEGRIMVDAEDKLPAPGTLILIDEEWMRLGPKSGGRATVFRAERSTRAAPHGAGALVHHGTRILRELPLGANREDWDL